MATLITIHRKDPAKLAAVTAEMVDLGAPSLRAVSMGDDVYYLLEGTHRACAAAALGIPVRLELVCYDAETQQELRVSDLAPGSDCDNPCADVIGNPRDSEIIVCEVDI